VLVEPSTDCKFLKTLDAAEHRVFDDGSYPLLVAVGFGMRGVDYRAPGTGIALFISTSFSHERDAIQGVNRVGRFGEHCVRYLVDGVALIDEKSSSTHCARVFTQIAANSNTVKAKTEL
jgi:hypothetical protein